MKKNRLILLLFFISVGTGFAQKSGFQIDFTNPESPVKALFYAAQNRDLSLLEGLCDPLNLGDGDTKRICALSTPTPGADSASTASFEKRRAEFVHYFEKGKINGAVTYSTEEDGTEYAKVPFWFNHPGGESRSNETMKLVKRNGNWYFFSF